MVAEGDFSRFAIFFVSFFVFLSVGGSVGELGCFSTGPITDTFEGSTSSSLSLAGVASSFYASLFSFLILYKGVAS